MKRLEGSIRFFAIIALTAIACVTACAAQVNVTTWHNDIGRTGQNNAETVLTSALVSNTNTFGRICSDSLDGKVYAQPLVVTGVQFMGGPPKTVVYVETQNDSMYAIDGTNCTILKGPVSLLPNAAQGEVAADCHGIGAGGCQTIQPTVGILSTPVIDTNTGTIYAVAESECPAATACAQNTTDTYFHRLHALDITTLATAPEKYNAPVQICATGCGRDLSGSTFTKNHIQRPGLLFLTAAQSGLKNDTVYLAFSLMDGAAPPLPSGWIYGYNAQNLSATPMSYSVTPLSTSEGGGIHQAGAGIAAGVDETGKMFLYVVTADGTFDLNTGGPDASDSFLKLNTNLTYPSNPHFFTPSDQCYRNSVDLDYGAGGTVLIPDGTVKAHPYMAVVGDKENYLWVMDRSKPGGYDVGGCTTVPGCPIGGQVPQCPPSQWANHNALTFNFATTNETRATPIYWGGNKSIYMVGAYTPMFNYPISDCTGTPLTCKVGAQTTVLMGSSTTPSVSSNLQGSTYSNGIVWAIKNPSDPPHRPPTPSPAILYAFDATTLVELYDSNKCLTMDAPGLATKFSTPTIANGYVYIGTQTDFDIYGPVSRTTCK